MPDPRPRICDYEGSNYRTEFWEGRGRDYEDQVERVALRRLLPPQGGRRLLEIGAGFGRLTNEYHKYRQVVLLDYSLSQLQYAQEKLGRDERYVYVAADAYQLPFMPGLFDAVTMVRVIHHMADVSQVLQQVRHVLAPNGDFILEHANKQNIKAILRYRMGQQTWNPHDLAPVEFVELNFDFHPLYIRRNLEKAGFAVLKRMPVSFFRLSALKNRVPTRVLVGADSLLQYSGLLYTPSIFVHSRAGAGTADNLNSAALFACPQTGAPLKRVDDTIVCEKTGRRWAVRDGIYDFKAPLED